MMLSAVALSGCAMFREPPDAYLVFFVRNEAAVPPEAANVIAAASGEAKRRPASLVTISGYTGRESDSRTNPALQRERFAAVENALAGRGVERNRISRDALNDADPLLPDVAFRRFEIRLVDPAPSR